MKCSPKFRQVARSKAKTGDAMGRPTCESSFLELPNAKLFVKTGGVKKSARDAENRMHVANAGFSRDGCRGRDSNGPSPTTPSRLHDVHYGNSENQERDATELSGDEDSNAVLFPRPLLLLQDATTDQ